MFKFQFADRFGAEKITVRTDLTSLEDLNEKYLAFLRACEFEIPVDAEVIIQEQGQKSMPVILEWDSGDEEAEEDEEEDCDDGVCEERVEDSELYYGLSALLIYESGETIRVHSDRIHLEDHAPAYFAYHGRTKFRQIAASPLTYLEVTEMPSVTPEPNPWKFDKII